MAKKSFWQKLKEWLGIANDVVETVDAAENLDVEVKINDRKTFKDDGGNGLRFLPWTWVLLGVLLLAGVAHAEPTPQNSRFFWEHDGVNSAGFYLYYAPESELPRVYSNQRRIQLPGGGIREVVVLSAGGDNISPGKWCGKITAYNAEGSESGFSNEACGNFFSLNPPTGMGTR